MNIMKHFMKWIPMPELDWRKFPVFKLTGDSRAYAVIAALSLVAGKFVCLIALPALILLLLHRLSNRWRSNKPNLLLLTILLASTIWCRAVVPPFQTVNLAFDYPNPGAVTFYIRATNGPSVEVIGVTTNTTFTWTNVTPLSWRLSVTASNIWGESNPSTPLILPQPPLVPTNLRPVTTSFRVTPPVAFERSTDLANWNERFRLFRPDSNGVQIVMQTVTPDSPFAFYRLRPTPVIGQPPRP